MRRVLSHNGRVGNSPCIHLHGVLSNASGVENNLLGKQSGSFSLTWSAKFEAK